MSYGAGTAAGFGRRLARTLDRRRSRLVPWHGLGLCLGLHATLLLPPPERSPRCRSALAGCARRLSRCLGRRRASLPLRARWAVAVAARTSAGRRVRTSRISQPAAPATAPSHLGSLYSAAEFLGGLLQRRHPALPSGEGVRSRGRSLRSATQPQKCFRNPTRALVDVGGEGNLRLICHRLEVKTLAVPVSPSAVCWHRTVTPEYLIYLIIWA